MSYHLVLTGHLGIDARRAEAAAGTAPRHMFMELAVLLGAELHEPDPRTTDTRPALLHRLLRTPPPLIALTRRLARDASDDDVIFCLGEAAALPLAHELIRAGKRSALISLGHSLHRPRIRAAALLTGCVARVDHFFVFTRQEATDPARFTRYVEQTDDRFFRPGAKHAGARPRVVSVGLERRDYATLAAAVRDLPVEMRISAFSRDARTGSRAHPVDTPPNWDMRFYDWPDLAELYRSADLVVIPLEPSGYAADITTLLKATASGCPAGITTLLEAAASGCPVLASDSDRLRGAFAAPESVAWVPPGDAGALRAAITGLLDDPERRTAMAQNAYAAQQAHHRLEVRVAEMADLLRRFRR